MGCVEVVDRKIYGFLAGLKIIESMASENRTVTTEASDDKTKRPLVTAHKSAPEWLVLTEDGNTDGWIAADWIVDIKNYR